MDYFLFMCLSCILKIYFIYLFMYLEIGFSIFLPYNPTLIENGIIFFLTAHLKLPTIVCKNVVQVVF